MITRRRVLTSAAAGAAALGTYKPRANARPNVVIVRFGGGVRRRETIEPATTFSPYLVHRLIERGTLYEDMRIHPAPGVATSHGEGTLHLLTGRYDHFENLATGFLEERFEPPAPTLFEYLRANEGIPAHRALIVNGEDRAQEESLGFSNHPEFGAPLRAEMLSLARFKLWLLGQRIEAANEQEAGKLRRQLAKLRSKQGARERALPEDPVLTRFWSGWRAEYGDTGLINPRGDALIAELAVRALSELEPRLMLVNFQDPDYVHWGNASFYRRGIAGVDAGLRRIHDAIRQLPAYRGNTTLVVVPDCGRDDNPLLRIPYQHHFNSDEARRIWCLISGPVTPRGLRISRPVEQIDVHKTVAALMGFSSRYGDGEPLYEALG